MRLDDDEPRKKMKIKLGTAQNASNFKEKRDANYCKGETEGKDYSKLELKIDEENRPIWMCGDGHIFLEMFSPFYKQAFDFLVAVAEPVCRGENIHEYQLTPHSLYPAVAAGIETETIIRVLHILSKTKIPKEVIDFIEASTANYGKVKLILKKDRYVVESSSAEISKILLKDEVISRARISQAENTTVDDEAHIHSFEVDPAQVENVKQRCLPSALNYPMLEEYDYKNDVNPSLDIELKPHAQTHPYQNKSLCKMFGNGRANSGIIVLPCGAGKSLVGVAATCIMKKSCLILVTSSVSVDQWAYQFKLWSNIRDEQIGRFTLKHKEIFSGNAGVLVATYNMIVFSGQRSCESEKIMEYIRNKEWGLMLLDEVHVVPAHMSRKAIGSIKTHCKLGLTATLVREDDKITDLNFLIGPKLYEANWMELAKEGYIANVLCAEVLCPMTKEFIAEYLKNDNPNNKQALYVMNPNKFRACEFLIRYHEQRGDKIIVFADNIFALKKYVALLRKPMICGSTSHNERTDTVDFFKSCQDTSTLLLSKVGDNSIDIPEANVIIQISSHGGSRRQEAQRLGRILRAKGRHEDRMAGGKEEFNAFFYSLVSTDTQEMYFSTKRQRFLVDQGYSFKVISTLPPPNSSADLSFHHLKDQLALLQEVLSAGDDDIGQEMLIEDGDDVALKQAQYSDKTKKASSSKNNQNNQKTKPKKRHPLLKGRGRSNY